MTFNIKIYLQKVDKFIKCTKITKNDRITQNYRKNTINEK